MSTAAESKILIVEDDMLTRQALLSALLIYRPIVAAHRPKTKPTSFVIPIRGRDRNKPCSCGSGVKAKRCHHEIKTERRYVPASKPEPRSAY